MIIAGKTNFVSNFTVGNILSILLHSNNIKFYIKK